MNKEEIEKAKQCLNEIIQNTYAEGKAKKLDILKKYIKELEQKESVLDKVIDIVKIIIKRTETECMYGTTDILEDLQKILKIIEGEKK